MGNTAHLAATLNKLITILLLIILAGQTSGYYHAQTYEISFMQEADEKGEKSVEEKHEKEYVSYTSHCKTGLQLKKDFGGYFCDLSVSPVLDHLTPPPDVSL